MKFLVITAAALVVLSGCANSNIRQIGGLTVSAVSSTQVEVLEPKIMQGPGGQLEVRGAVYRAYSATTTAGTHVDITFRDNAGNALHAHQSRFSPAELRRRARGPQPKGTYSFVLPQLPAGTTHIEVRAHEGSHP